MHLMIAHVHACLDCPCSCLFIINNEIPHCYFVSGLYPFGTVVRLYQQCLPRVLQEAALRVHQQPRLLLPATREYQAHIPQPTIDCVPAALLFQWVGKDPLRVSTDNLPVASNRRELP